MSGHADTIRSYLDGFIDGRDIHDFPTFDETIAALDALLAENQQDTKLICGLEEDVAAWKRSADESAAENQRLRDETERLRPLAEIGAASIEAGHVSVAREALAGEDT